jgi:hypothetical protein
LIARLLNRPLMDSLVKHADPFKLTAAHQRIISPQKAAFTAAKWRDEMYGWRARIGNI